MAATFVTAARGSPDWQDVVRSERFELLAAYDEPQLRFAVPKAARLAARAGGTPDLFLEFVSDRNDPDLANSLYAMLHIGFEAEGDLAAARAALGPAGDGLALLPLSFSTGTRLHLVCGDAHETAPFAWESALRARLDARIPLPIARLLYGALGAGGVVVGSAIECEVPAVLPRPATTVRFDARAVVQALQRALNGPGGSMPFEALVDWLAAAPQTLFQFEGTAAATSGLGLALAGRLRHFFGRAAPCPNIADGPHIFLDGPAADASAPTTWNLRTPFFAGVPVFLRCDPFGFLAGSVARERVTGFASVPALPDALRTRRLTIASGLPACFANCTQIALRVRVDKDVSASGQTDAQALVLYPAAQRSDTVDLHYAKTGSAHPYSTSVKVVGDDSATAGPWIEGRDDYVFVDASQVPVPYIGVRATAGLLAMASIQVALAGAAAADLDAAHPATAFLLAGTDAAARLAVTARELEDPQRMLPLDLPCSSVELDLASFPSYGAQSVRVTVQFHEGANALRLAFAAESGDAEAVVLRFSPATPEGAFGYFAANPFRTRYRFRAWTGTDDVPTPWSELLAPDRELRLDLFPSGLQRQAAPIRNTDEEGHAHG